MNLLEDPWIPIRRLDRREERIAPWQLTESFEENPVVALAAPRPDFKGGLMQFLIGLLQTAVPPDEEQGREWEQWLIEPPSPDELREAFSPYVSYFQLDGDGSRFMQDFDLENGEEREISALLIDAPGENTQKQNVDHFIKRGRIIGLCPSCVASALFVLQVNSPSGGKGHRTSLRGGGPLTTLILVDPQGSGLEREVLWDNIWLNSLDSRVVGNLPGKKEYGDSDIFPWLIPTRTSEPGTGTDISPSHVHPLQMYWGMPRRIWLNWEQVSEGICDICGLNCEILINRYETKSYGLNYVGPWQHPLSPHWIDKEGRPSPLHPQRGGFSYRHWVGLVDDGDNRLSARVVTEFRNKKLPEEQFRLWAFGYDMDNMKPRCWYEIEFPLFLIKSEPLRRTFSGRTQELVEASAMVAGFVRSCIKDAWFRRSGDVKGDTAFLMDEFFQKTESSFYEIIKRLLAELREGGDGWSTLSTWYTELNRNAILQFDDWVTRESLAFADTQRIMEARRKLIRQLSGKKIREILHVSPDKKEKGL